MSDDPVLAEREGGVLTLTLNRPERNNAYTVAMEHRYFDLLEEAADDPDVRAIVLTGAGRSFCPGLDVEMLEEGINAGGLATERPRRSQTYPLSVPKPIIAAINGACAGIGLIVALTADVRFGARGAKMTTAWARRGLVVEHGMSWLIPRLVGVSRGLELMISGRVFTTDEAHRIGLIHELTEPGEVLERAQEYAADLAANVSPVSMAFAKWQAYADLQQSGFEEASELSLDLAQAINEYPDSLEGVRSFVERRPPQFDGLPPGFDAGEIAARYRSRD